MVLENWELSHSPCDKDKNRWRLKLKVDEKSLVALMSGLPGNLSRPFLLENENFDFSFFVYEAQGDDISRLAQVLKIGCDTGRVIGQEQAGGLDAMLDQVAQGMAQAAQAVAPQTPPPPAPDAEIAAPYSATAEFHDLDLNPNYLFEGFVIGPNNRFTAAAAQAVADNSGKIYNPFFIYGGVGLGKTHLMHAVGHYVRKKNPKVRILYVTTEKFMGDVIDSIRRGTLLQMRDHYRQADLLLVDDIQFLVESESTQEEFFHTFNVLHQSGKQIIITSDRPPRQLTTLEDRLRSRFEWGLIADIKSPNLETRVAILKKKGEMEHLNLDDNIMLYIASKLKSNIRELEGFLKRINAYASLTHQEVNMELVRSVMADLLPDEEQEEPPAVPAPAPAPPPVQAAPPPPVAVPPPAPAPAPTPFVQYVIPSAPPVNKVPAPGQPPFEAKNVPEDAVRAVDPGLKAVEVVFFYPEGKQEELERVKNRFTDVIRKHKLKFRLEGLAELPYACAGKIDYAQFADAAKKNHVTIAVVLGPPPDAGAEDFGNLLATVMDDEGLSLQLVSWHEINKDYRYLNLSLDITLLKHSS